jgi:hypothetical protein
LFCDELHGYCVASEQLEEEKTEGLLLALCVPGGESFCVADHLFEEDSSRNSPLPVTQAHPTSLILHALALCEATSILLLYLFPSNKRETATSRHFTFRCRTLFAQIGGID